MTTPRPMSTSAGPPRGRGPAWERPGARPARNSCVFLLHRRRHVLRPRAELVAHLPFAGAVGGDVDLAALGRVVQAADVDPVAAPRMPAFLSALIHLQGAL